MPKSKRTSLVRLKRAPPQVHALFKKRNDKRMAQLIKMTRENGRMAIQLARLINLPEKIPSALLKELKAAPKRMRDAGLRNLIAAR